MALVVEDGTGSNPNATVYVDVDYVDQYFIDHGDPVKWSSLTTSAKESAIRYATIYLEGKYRFKGGIITHTQPLSWPRSMWWDCETGRSFAGDGVIPEAIKMATAELALRHVTEDLFYNNQIEDSRVTQESVDGHSISFESSASVYSRGFSFEIVNHLLRPYITNSLLQTSIRRG